MIPSNMGKKPLSQSQKDYSSQNNEVDKIKTIINLLSELNRVQYELEKLDYNIECNQTNQHQFAEIFLKNHLKNLRES